MTTVQPLAAQLREMATRGPHREAVRLYDLSGGSASLSVGELDRASNRVARWLSDQDVVPGDKVASFLGNSLDHFVAAFGTWKCGGCFVPLNARMATRELSLLRQLALPRVELWQAPEPSGCSDEPLPDRVPDPGLALASGGSTGTPKLVVTAGPFGGLPHDFLAGVGMRPGMTQLVCGPVHHNGPFVMSYYGLLLDHRLAVLERFDADLALDVIERERVELVFLVPTMMRRLLDAWRDRPRDLSSLKAVVHSSAPCPEWLKRAWIDLVGATHVYEAYGASEAPGGAHVRGDEWLLRPGTVGRPYSELRVLDENGHALGPRQVGEVFMRRHPDGRATSAYLGDGALRTTPEGFASVGDLGWLDEDGYLYLSDRRQDLIITGGINVYPAEVEAVLSAHPKVADVAVVGVPDEGWGARVHAIVQPMVWTDPPDERELLAFCREQLSAYKVPKTLDYVVELPRSDAGKLRRSGLA